MARLVNSVSCLRHRMESRLKKKTTPARPPRRDFRHEHLRLTTSTMPCSLHSLQWVALPLGIPKEGIHFPHEHFRRLPCWTWDGVSPFSIFSFPRLAPCCDPAGFWSRKVPGTSAVAIDGTCAWAKGAWAKGAWAKVNWIWIWISLDLDPSTNTEHRHYLCIYIVSIYRPMCLYTICMYRYIYIYIMVRQRRSH